MARINKKEAVARSKGLPTKEQLMMSPQNTDTLATYIDNQDGTQTPAALTEGEFVFSLPAIVALGEGEYDSGLALLEEMHEELKAIGKGMLEETQAQGGLGAAVDMV